MTVLSKLLKFTCAISLLVFSNFACAALFDVSTSDLSRQYLGEIFGGSVGTIVLSSSYNSLLGNLFEKFNTIILTVATLVVSYTTFVGVINTAQEGEVMGQKFSSVWLPLRSILGLMLMIPIKGGYSLVQISVMWVVLQGIGAANSLYSVLISSLSSGGSVSGSANLSDSDSLNIVNSLVSLYPKIAQHAMCLSSLKYLNNNLDPTWTDYENIQAVVDNKLFTTSTTVTATESTISFGPNSVCGKIVIKPNQSGDSSTAKFTEHQADYLAILTANITSTISSIQNITDDIVETTQQSLEDTDEKPYIYPDNSDGNTERRTTLHSKLRTGNFLQRFKTTLEALSATFTSEMLSLSEEVSADTNEDFSRYSTYGWITAGTLTKNMTSTKNTTELQLYFNPGSFFTDTAMSLENDLFDESDQLKEFVTAYIEVLSEYDNGKEILPTSLTNISGTSSTADFNLALSGPSLDSDTQEMLSNVGGNMSFMIKACVSELTKIDPRDFAERPFYYFKLLGKAFMNKAEFFWFLTFSAGAVAAISLSFGIWGSAGGDTVGLFFLALLAMLSGVFMMMWGLGATIGIYTPFIPYIMFFTAAVGWMFSVVEAIIGAPILALALLAPNREELGNIHTGLMIIANLFLRPLLIIFSLIIALRILSAVIYFLNTTILPVMQASEDALFSQDMLQLSTLVVMFIYVSLILAMVNQCFSLLQMIPDRILRWIGSQEQSMIQGAQVAQETKQGTEAGSKAAGDFGRGIAGKAVSGAEAKSGQMAEKRAGQASEGKAAAKEAASEKRHQELLGAITKKE